ncbi:MAG: hypothetical protein ACM3N9_07990 [Syntrophothermus sp.]
MKQLKTLLGACLLAGMAFFTSCSSSDNTTTPASTAPNINFIGGSGYISSDQTIAQGTPYKIGVNASSNTTSNAKLTKLTITKVYNNSPQTWDTTLNTNTINFSFTDTATQVGATKWYVKVTDKDNQTKEISLTITTTAAAGEINTFTQKILGAQGSTTGSSFASIDGTIYNLNDAKLNSAKIDWMYYYGATNLATLAAPSDPSAAEVFNGTNGPATWSTRNATKFKDVTGQVDFATVTDDSKIVQMATGATATVLPHLSNDKVLAFIAANGKMGLIQVVTITGTSGGSITLNVKVQK